MQGLAALLREQGPWNGARYLLSRLGEEAYDRRYGIRTSEYFDVRALGYEGDELVGHSAAPYPALHAALRRVPVRAGVDAFLDYGSGLGRAIVAAARRPFARVIGVELSPALAVRGRENVARASGLRAPVSIEQGDARDFVVPADVTVVHAYNPFGGRVLADVVERIRQSLRAHPRELRIVFGNPAEFERIVAGEGWVERLWFARFYPHTGYGIYRCTAPPRA